MIRKAGAGNDHSGGGARNDDRRTLRGLVNESDGNGLRRGGAEVDEEYERRGQETDPLYRAQHRGHSFA
jgi:hypothetical protein